MRGFRLLVRVKSDNARISRRISASRSGGSGDTLINIIDAADLKLCLLVRFFFAAEEPDLIFTVSSTVEQILPRNHAILRNTA